MSKLLGIDYGQSKVGLALADTETKTAVPFEVIRLKDLKTKEFKDSKIKRLKDLVVSEGIEKIVVGLPLSMKGEETEQTKEVQSFIKDLRSKINTEVVAEDERLTTVQAKRSGKDDAVAAMYILQSYIDRNYG